MLKNKTVVITGGAGLLGSDFTRAIAEAGGTAVIADIDQEAAAALKERLIASGLKGQVDTIALDITSRDSIQNCIEELSNRHGSLDAVVNNAYPRNRHYGREFFEVEYQDLCENLNLHLGGYFLVAQQFARVFKELRRGHIINMASIYGATAPRFEVYDNTEMTMPVEYALIKSAVLQLTRYLTAYLKDSGVRVNAISPGGILDGQPQSFVNAYRQQCSNIGMLQPKDISSTLVFLLSDQSRAINGQSIVVDDGFSL